MPKTLNDQKLALLKAVRWGNSSKVIQILDSIRDPQQKRELANCFNEKGIPVLHLAASGRHPKCVNALIGAGADVNAQDANGNTPLHYSARSWRPFSSGHGPFTGVLGIFFVGAGAAAIISGPLTLGAGFVALGLAAAAVGGAMMVFANRSKRQDKEVMRLLCENGARILENKKGNTALDFLNEKGKEKLKAAVREYELRSQALDRSQSSSEQPPISQRHAPVQQRPRVEPPERLYGEGAPLLRGKGREDI